MRFDRVIVLDWSASSTPKRGADSIWIGEVSAAGALPPVNCATRDAAMAHLSARIAAEGGRLLIGADFPFAYPTGFARILTGQRDALAVWDHLAGLIEDRADNTNNRFAVAADINRRFSGVGPFWGCPPAAQTPDLPAKGTTRTGHEMPERRVCERLASGTQPVWKLYTTGSVGSQALLGLPRLARLRADHPGRIAVWPFEDCATVPVVLAEVWPSLLAPAVTAAVLAGRYAVKDAAQVDLLARALWQMSQDDALAALMSPDVAPEVLAEEGWILGIGHHNALLAAAQGTGSQGTGSQGTGANPPALTPPRLRNDCFAMPQGVDWVPVDVALSRLRAGLVPVTATEHVALAQAGGRVLADDVRALRPNPPRANSAVDGYGFAHAATGTGVQRLPLVAGRAAAGQPHHGAVPFGSAVRILTGAILPEGVDTVVLEEDCATDGAVVAFDGPIKPRSNTRRAGEDVAQGALALPAGHVMRAPDLSLLAALGVDRIAVRRRLRVGVLSTGDEIVTAGPALPHQIYDANRPMLLALAERWGCDPVDLGHVRDNEAAIAARLDDGARAADVILTSGGASAGDEDHVSRLLRLRGALSSWRIAMKPGRPLALALWDGVPVFGLPGNPVAAMTCALIFARPALSLLSGAGWLVPQGFEVPAAFSKRKKAGRREYLRARLDDAGHAEVFASEGSGRISGLAWATGLVELPDGAMDVAPGDRVRFIPYASFGF